MLKLARPRICKCFNSFESNAGLLNSL